MIINDDRQYEPPSWDLRAISRDYRLILPGPRFRPFLSRIGAKVLPFDRHLYSGSDWFFGAQRCNRLRRGASAGCRKGWRRPLRVGRSGPTQDGTAPQNTGILASASFASNQQSSSCGSGPGGILNPNSLNFVKGDLVIRTVVKLCRSRGLVSSDGLGVFDRAAILQVGCDFR